MRSDPFYLRHPFTVALLVVASVGVGIGAAIYGGTTAPAPTASRTPPVVWLCGTVEDASGKHPLSVGVTDELILESKVPARFAFRRQAEPCRAIRMEPFE